MRILNTIVGVLVALFIILFAVSNMDAVQIKVWPLPYEVEMRLYGVILLAVLAGFIAGGIGTWMVGHRKRRELKRLRRQVRDLEQSLAQHVNR